MKNDEYTKDTLADATPQPKLPELQEEYTRSFSEGEGTGTIVGTLTSWDYTRLMRWNGQSDDGKKWQKNQIDGKQVFPWDGASDARIPLVDTVINSTVDLLCVGHERSRLQVSGMEVSDAEGAKIVERLLKWLTDVKLRGQINLEREYLANYQETYGFAVMQVGWEEKKATTLFDINVDYVRENFGEDMLAVLLDPDQIDLAIQLVSEQLPGVKNKKLRALLKTFREEGEASVPVTEVVSSVPRLTALRPYDDIGFPPETLTLQNARVIFVRRYMTEAQLNAMAEEDDWDKKWIKAVKKTAGHQSVMASTQEVEPTGLAGARLTTYDRYDNLIEVAWAYARQSDEDGVNGIYCTVFSPHALKDDKDQDIYAKHELQDYAHGVQPFVAFTAENRYRRISDSRGVPEIAETWQDEVKAQHDAVVDYTSITTVPPITVNRRIGQVSELGPAVQLSVNRPDDYAFMSPPTRQPSTAFEMISSVERMAATYFGIPHPDIPPAATQVKQQRKVGTWLSCWTEVYKQMFALARQYMEPNEIARVTNSRVGISGEAPDVTGQYDFVLRFDVRDLDNEYLMEKYKAFSTFVIPQDKAGSIDNGAYVRSIAKAIAPDIAEEVVVDPKSATTRTVDDVHTDLAKMMLGIEPTYSENDPAASIKLQVFQQALQSNPKAMEMMKSDQSFQLLAQNYVKNLQQSIVQEQNKQVGRTGVTPIAGAGA